MYFYSNQKTKELLESSKPRVYLYGSCTGYNNFGDIIQLKNTILFHKRFTGLEPIIIMDLNSLTSANHPKLLESWYHTSFFIFLSSKNVDANEADLIILQNVMSGGLLHVYGGGFLNHFWAKSSAAGIESILKQLAVSDYIFSGQQIDNTAIKYLKDIFQVKIPLAFGLRDRQSLSIMKKNFPWLKPKFSFDDVTEVFEDWIKYSHSTPKIWLKTKIQKPTIMWHFNFSYYTINDITAMLRKINLAIQYYPKYSATTAVAYNDKSYGLIDSLRSLIEFDTSFPYTNYQVVSLAQLALIINPVNNSYPNIMHSINNIAFAVTSSYHTAMFSNFLGIPAYLISTNDYYHQKQRGLGYKNNYKNFLQDPTINLPSYEKEKSDRRAWLDTIKVLFNQAINTNKKRNNQVIKLNRSAVTKGSKLVYRGYM